MSDDEKRGDALVMFGLTGDLGEKKLFPAIAELAIAGRLRGPVIGVGRSSYTDEDLWDMFVEAAGPDARELSGELDLRYVEGDSAERSTYDAIAEAIGDAQCPVVYAALPPDLFAEAATQIGTSSLPSTTRLVVEKPFGDGAASAAELYEAVTAAVPAEQLFMVDHFLAKASVENLLAFRASNPMIEAALRAGPVKRIEFTMAEAFGVDGRGGFYDSVGAVKDVVQNHILQTIAVLVMEPPADDSADAFDNSRAELLATMRPIDPDAVVLGQFDGYRDIDDVASDSTTETFVACVLTIDNPRWDGVDIVVRTGKELADSYTEAVVVFSDGDDETPPNRLRFLLKPDQCISIEAAMLGAGSPQADHPNVAAVLSTPNTEGHGEFGDYATMLDGALTGDQHHFARIDDVRAAWRIVEPILASETDPEPYEPGTMGPATAGALLVAGYWIERLATN